MYLSADREHTQDADIFMREICVRGRQLERSTFESEKPVMFVTLLGRSRGRRPRPAQTNVGL